MPSEAESLDDAPGDTNRLVCTPCDPLMSQLQLTTGRLSMTAAPRACCPSQPRRRPRGAAHRSLPGSRPRLSLSHHRHRRQTTPLKLKRHSSAEIPPRPCSLSRAATPSWQSSKRQRRRRPRHRRMIAWLSSPESDKIERGEWYQVWTSSNG